MAQYAVIGLGRFGATLALQLVKLGHDVIGVDSDAKVAEDLVDQLTHVMIADITDGKALAELNLTDFDAVIVAIGENILASLLGVVHLKNLEVETIWVKAVSASHHLILNRLGVARIIHPEEEMGRRAALLLSYPVIRDYMSLGSGQYVVEVGINNNTEGKRLAEILSAGPTPVAAILVKRHEQLLPNPSNEFVLEAGDSLILAGTRTALTQLAPRL